MDRPSSWARQSFRPEQPAHAHGENDAVQALILMPRPRTMSRLLAPARIIAFSRAADVV